MTIVQMNYDAIDAGAKQVVESQSSGKLEELLRMKDLIIAKAVRRQETGRC